MRNRSIFAESGLRVVSPGEQPFNVLEEFGQGDRFAVDAVCACLEGLLENRVVGWPAAHKDNRESGNKGADTADKINPIVLAEIHVNDCQAYRLAIQETQSFTRAAGGADLEMVILQMELIKISDGDFVVHEQDKMFGDRFGHVWTQK